MLGYLIIKERCVNPSPPLADWDLFLRSKRTPNYPISLGVAKCAKKEAPRTNRGAQIYLSAPLAGFTYYPNLSIPFIVLFTILGIPSLQEGYLYIYQKGIFVKVFLEITEILSLTRIFTDF